MVRQTGDSLIATLIPEGGNAACAAPAARDAERPSMRSHAERGNDGGDGAWECSQ